MASAFRSGKVVGRSAQAEATGNVASFDNPVLLPERLAFQTEVVVLLD